MKILGVLLIVIGIVVSAWLGIYVMLYGGLLAVIQAWDANAHAVAWGIIRAIFWVIGILPGICCAIVGAALFELDKIRRDPTR